MPDVAQRIDVYFKGIWRRSGEAMGVYLVREDEAYGRLAAALLRAQRTEGAEASSGGVAAETAALEEPTTPASSAAASATAAFKRKASALEVLPAEVRGWNVLNNANLEPTERAAVLASAHNKIDYEKIKVALKANWGDNDLRERDRVKKPRSNNYANMFGPAYTDEAGEPDDSWWGDGDEEQWGGVV